MIATHPQETMPNNGPSEKQLSEISRKMLTHFEAWLDGYTTPKSFTLFSNLTRSINEFLDAFESWTAQDPKELAEGMISHWINLEKLWLTVRHQPDVEENWRPKIEAQQLHIQKKLQKLGSVALDKLYEAQLAMTAEQQVAEENASDDQAALISTSPQRFPVFQRQQANISDSVSGSSAASSASSSITREPSPVNVPSIQNAEPQQQQNVNVQDIMNSFGKEFSAEYLAHELTLDPEFEIKPRVLTPLEEQVKAMAKSAFFDSVREDFSKGEYRLCPGLIEDIKKVCS
jgi:flagellar biosynthesis GTPase FlhF